MSTRWDAFTGERYHDAPRCVCGDPRDAGAPMCAGCLQVATKEEVELALERQEKERKDG